MIYDVIICGAGLSGILLANRLVPSQPGQKFLIIDKSGEKSDILYGFWEEGKGEFDSIMEGISDTLITIDNESRSIHKLKKYSYKYFYMTKLSAEICRKLSDKADFVKDEVVAIEETGEGVQVTGLKQNYFGKKVFSSIGARNSKSSICSNIQHFHGCEIKTKATFKYPIFMDFSAGDKKQFRFGYLMPLQNNRLFIHLIDYYSMPSKADLQSYVGKLLQGVDYKILHIEKGITPLNYHLNWLKDSKIEKIGVAGGYINPATGYGVKSFMDYAESVSEHRYNKLFKPERLFFYPMYMLMTILINIYSKGAKRLFSRINRMNNYDAMFDFIEAKGGFISVWEMIMGILFK